MSTRKLSEKEDSQQHLCSAAHSNASLNSSIVQIKGGPRSSMGRSFHAKTRLLENFFHFIKLKITQVSSFNKDVEKKLLNIKERREHFSNLQQEQKEVCTS